MSDHSINFGNITQQCHYVQDRYHCHYRKDSTHDPLHRVTHPCLHFGHNHPHSVSDSLAHSRDDIAAASSCHQP